MVIHVIYRCDKCRTDYKAVNHLRSVRIPLVEGHGSMAKWEGDAQTSMDICPACAVRLAEFMQPDPVRADHPLPHISPDQGKH